jgi:chromate transport protein ChrA
MTVKPYLKAVVAVVIAVLTSVAAAITDGTVTDDEKKAIVAAFVTAFLVYLVPNKKAPEA